jgi:hypothetical protein
MNAPDSQTLQSYERVKLCPHISLLNSEIFTGTEYKRMSQKESAINLLLDNTVTMSMYNSIIFLYSPNPFQQT